MDHVLDKHFKGMNEGKLWMLHEKLSLMALLLHVPTAFTNLANPSSRA